MINETFKKTKLPDKPGVYFFLKGKEILYIGKATSLKDRVKSYFGKDLIETRGPIILDMVFKADKIDWKETDNVLEALILEANLIKKFSPVAWTHINFYGRYDLLRNDASIDLDKIIRQLSTKAIEVDYLHLLNKNPEIQVYAEI